MSGRLLRFLVVVAVLAVSANAICAGEPIPMHVGGEVRKMSREVCALKAVEAMTVGEKFPFAEITADGNARGWNDKSAVLVLSLPTPVPDEIQIMVIAASKSNDEAARLRSTIRAHVFDAPPPQQKSTPSAAGGAAPRSPIPLCWKSEERSAISLLRLFNPIATLVLEKRGFATNEGGTNIVLGGYAGRTVVVFLSSTASGVAARLHVVTATEEENSELAVSLLARLVQLIYE